MFASFANFSLDLILQVCSPITRAHIIGEHINLVLRHTSLNKFLRIFPGAIVENFLEHVRTKDIEKPLVGMWEQPSILKPGHYR